MTDCLFCRMIAGEVPADVVLQTDRVLAFRDINPQAPTHVLVTNTGPQAGQSVFHVHFHLLGGRRMTWPPG